MAERTRSQATNYAESSERPRRGVRNIRLFTFNMCRMQSTPSHTSDIQNPPKTTWVKLTQLNLTIFYKKKLKIKLSKKLFHFSKRKIVLEDEGRCYINFFLYFSIFHPRPCFASFLLCCITFYPFYSSLLTTSCIPCRCTLDRTKFIQSSASLLVIGVARRIQWGRRASFSDSESRLHTRIKVAYFLIKTYYLTTTFPLLLHLHRATCYILRHFPPPPAAIRTEIYCSLLLLSILSRT